MEKERIVVKVGTSTLTNENGKNDLRSFYNLSEILSDISNSGRDVVLVSSGAIAAGANKMNIAKRPETIAEKQAAAAVGQCSVMFLYNEYFSRFDKTIAQILLTDDDIKNTERRGNLINTFEELFKIGAIPIVNENDSVDVEQIMSPDKLFGDNDTLSALVAKMCNADKLIILSDIDGLYDEDPRKNSSASLITEINGDIDKYFENAGGAGTRRGTGGMITKLKAACMASENGIETYILNGRHPEKIYNILDGKSAGTKICAKK